jgi:iron complex outermembrane recepter protein
MNYKTFFISVFFFVCANFAFAQKRTITGTVTDASTGTPLQGVSVTVKPSGAGTISNAGGTFSVQASNGDKIEFTYIGYNIVMITVNNQTTLNIKMESASTDLGQIVLVGTRSGGRIKTESPVPIDVININQAGTPTARMDLTSVLNYSAPSFNYNKQSGADGADHIDLGTLRGLGPDQTLVLINGKRRHQTAFVGLFGTRGRGNSGADMNAFPESAVDRIEILRDGASAQYGSDAMAGVINVILKKDVNHWTINTGWAGYNDHKFNSLNTEDPSQYYTGNQMEVHFLFL